MKFPLVKIKCWCWERNFFFEKGKEDILRGRTWFWLWLDSWAVNATFTLAVLIVQYFLFFLKRESLHNNVLMSQSLQAIPFSPTKSESHLDLI